MTHVIHHPPARDEPAGSANPLTDPQPAPADRLRWLPPLAALLLGTVASVACFRLAGPAQGALFGACAIVVLLVPSLVEGGRASLAALATALAAGAGALVGPAWALRTGDLNLQATLPAAAATSTLAVAAAGLTLLLSEAAAARWWAVAATAAAVGLLTGWVVAGVGEFALTVGTVLAGGTVAAAVSAGVLVVARVRPAAAGWAVTLLLLAWLAWPVWLSPWLPGRDALVHALSAAHPLLAIDAALTAQGAPPWTEHRLMYNRLSVLQQHVAASPPRDVSATVLLNLGLAIPGFAAAGAAGFVARRRAKRDVPS